MKSKVECLEQQCAVYQDTITSLTASLQALYELLLSKNIITEEDGLLLKKSYVRSQAGMDQLFAAIKHQQTR